MSNFTPQQSAAINGTGNLLVVAGAGTGKTHTLIARCLRLILAEHVSVENILMVTFTEAAAAEMRGRLRAELLKRQTTQPDDEWLAQQLALLDAAHICTLHSFCLQLAREHFHELGLDPQFNILDESQTRPLQRAALDDLLEKHYTSSDETSGAVRELIRSMGRGSDGAIRKLVLKLHAFSQSLPNPTAWLEEQTRRFAQIDPHEWRNHFAVAVSQLRDEWSARLNNDRGQTTALKLASDALAALPAKPDFVHATQTISAIAAADVTENWPRGTKGKFRAPLKTFFEETAFLNALVPDGDDDPLAEDWNWARGAMTALLGLVREFAADFATRKREFGGVDFTDLEQCALRLLRDAPTALAWQERLTHIFVDEYQDINAAQDAILTALSRPGGRGNRFLVGDVKQSIYRFRLANPHIFQSYEAAWRSRESTFLSSPKGGGEGRGEEAQLFPVEPRKLSAQFPSPQPSPRLGGERESFNEPGQALSLTENFRSRQAILDFVNPLFATLMRADLGGVNYEPLEFGAPQSRALLANTAPRVEFHLIAKSTPTAATADEDDSGEESETGSAPADLLGIEREAQLIARRLQELHASGHQIWDKESNDFRAVKWSDMAVLLRSPSGRAEAFAKEFSRAGIPLNAARAGFFASLEVSDLLNLLRLLDNPLQDVPLAAVLRSPLVGLTMDELVEIRLAERRDLLWSALVRVPKHSKDTSPELRAKVAAFLEQFHRWRELARQTSLSQTLETALNDTHYEPMLLAGARGPERVANVRRLLDLARQFDPYQRQGLHRFLRFVRLQEDEELDLEPASPSHADAVRLLSIHRSKGLEFPVVALASMGTNFNEQDLGGAVLLDEELGLCPKITPPGADQSYASLPHKLARQNARRELRGEELRLLYVAMTRARDTLLLVGTTNDLLEKSRWESASSTAVETKAVLAARSHLDWLRLWLPLATNETEWLGDSHGANRLLTWRIVADNDEGFQSTAPVEPTSAGESISTATPPRNSLVDLKARLNWKYPHTAATNESAKTSVTALRKRAGDESDDEARPAFRFTSSILAPPPPSRRTTKLSAAEIGIAHHTFQQYVTIERSETELDLRNEAEALLAAGVLTEEQQKALNFDDLTAFWQSDVGAMLRKVPAAAINREMEFTASLTAADLKTLPALPSNRVLAADDFIVVQGQVDLAVVLPEEIWLLDFKTDAVDETSLGEKIKQYAPQLEVYACALEKIYRRPVTRCWLHFLRAHKTVEL
jgi:ATP-dependent helicase/nuclease subunit A